MRYLIALLFSFSAIANVNVKDFATFDAAAQAAKPTTSGSLYGHVDVPAGWYNLDKKTTVPAVWHIKAGAEFGLPANYAQGIDNLSFLDGVIFKETARGRLSSWVMGGTDWQIYQDIRASVIPTAASVFSVVAKDTGALATYATTAQKAYSEGNIGMQSYCVNSSLNKQNCWAGYFETNKADKAGTTATIEVTSGNYGKWTSAQRIVPSGNYGANAGVTSALWVSGAAGNGAFETPIKSSAAMTIVGGVSGAGFDAGIICTDSALANSTAKECMRMGAGQQVIWHGAGFDPKAAIQGTAEGELHIKIWSNGKKVFKFTKDGLVLPSGKLIN